MKIVKLTHIHYDNTLSDFYYFKTEDDVERGSIVFCNTRNGATIGRVFKVYTTIEELFDTKDLPNLKDLKECKLLSSLMKVWNDES